MFRALRWVRGTPRRLASFYRRTPLRVKLVATVLLLVLVALVGSGLAVRATMNSYLIGRVDAQLATVSTTQHSGDGGGSSHDGGGDGGGNLPSSYIVVELRADGSTYSAANSNQRVDSGEPLPTLPHLTSSQTRSSGKRLFTVGSVRGDGQWRVLAQSTTLPDGTTGTVMVAQSLRDVDNTVNRLTVVLLVIGAGALVIIAGVGYVVVRASLRPLRAVEHTAAQIAAGDLTHRVPETDPRTEVGHLATAVNTMLGKIETAFAERAASERAAKSSEERMRISENAARRSEERMRSFVADASHELRTPLTTIRGFAELYRQGAAGGQADVARYMNRIESEATRMGLLVEDLLLLARMDQERPLAQDLVDVLTIAGDARHDAQVLDPERPVYLDIGPTEEPPVVVGDEARLRQVLSNLLTNALKYTPAHTPVTIGVSTVLGDGQVEPTVRLTVTDEGPGLSNQASARVFERFFRIDDARNRDDGGAGLGLAIVAALVAGHGGTVGVDSSPGFGACFWVELPLARPA